MPVAPELDNLLFPTPQAAAGGVAGAMAVPPQQPPTPLMPDLDAVLGRYEEQAPDLDRVMMSYQAPQIGQVLGEAASNSALFAAREYFGGSQTNQFPDSWEEVSQRLTDQFPNLSAQQLEAMRPEWESQRAQAFQGHLMAQHIGQARQGRTPKE